MTENDALKHAIDAGRGSMCAKSKRGVVIFSRSAGIISAASNGPPPGFKCDGSDACKAGCGLVAVHAEQRAILDAHYFGKAVSRTEMLHVKVVDGKAVPSGGPSCVHCSKLILGANIEVMWLLEDVGGLPTLVRYTALDFHRATLKNCGLHVGR